MSGLLGVPLGGPGSGRDRYARAMRLWAEGHLAPAQLEAYRVAAADDRRSPAEVLADRQLPVPADPARSREAAIAALVEEADRYLAGLAGPGVAEVRRLIARWRDGPVGGDAAGNAVVSAQLDPALAAVAAEYLALAAAIAAAAPHLRWITYDGYAPDQIGADFSQGHAYCTLIGAGGAIAAEGFDLGLFLIAPHVLYRDHAHPAPELYAPLTGPHGWRFGPGGALVTKSAHQPVWNPPLRPHLTKVGPVPFLCLYAWTRDVNLPAHVIPADDWPELERLRLG
jgi:hypothetical protein